jgi:hypothetical protein
VRSFPLIPSLLLTLFATYIDAQIPAFHFAGTADPARECSLPGLTSVTAQSTSDDALLAAYNSQASLVQSLEATVLVKAKSGPDFAKRGKDAKPAPTMLSFRAPASLRMTGAIPFSARRSFDFASNGKEFRLLVPDGKRMRFYVGSVDAAPSSANPRENLRPQPIVDALHWTRGVLHNPASGKENAKTRMRTIQVDLAAALEASVKTAEVDFNMASGTVASITFRDPRGVIVSEVNYADWQDLVNGDNGTGDDCFPRRIAVVQPQQNLQLEMKVLVLSVNPHIPPSRFELIPPRGIPVTRLGSSESGTKMGIDR